MSHRAAQRSDTVRSFVLVGALLLLVTSLQTSLLGRLRPFGVVPDLTMLSVLSIAYFCGKEIGAVTGIVGGFLIDAVGGGSIIVLPLVYLVLCYTVGHYARAVIPKRWTVYVVMLGSAVLVRCGVTLLLACMQYSSVSLAHLLLYATLPELLINAALGALLYFPFRIFCRLLLKRRRSI